MYGSSAINNIKFKCGNFSMPHAISGVERTVQGNSKYFKNGIMVYADNDLGKA